MIGDHDYDDMALACT